MNTNEQLKPCPFCGGTKLKVDGTRKYNSYANVYHTTMSVRCNICHARGKPFSGLTKNYVYGESRYEVTTVENLKQQAIEAWNRRGEG